MRHHLLHYQGAGVAAEAYADNLRCQSTSLLALQLDGRHRKNLRPHIHYHDTDGDFLTGL